MPTTASGMFNLYTSGPVQGSGTFPVYTFGVHIASGIQQFYTHGYTSGNGPLNLYLQGEIPSVIDNNLNLYLNASTSGTIGLYNTLDFYINSSPLVSSMNLSLLGSSDPVNVKGNMNLFLGSQIPSINDSVLLYILSSEAGNTLGTVTKGIDLFTQGLGLIDGAIPSTGWMNLFLENRGASNSLGLFLNATGPTTESLNLYQFGVLGIENNSINIMMPAYGILNQPLNMFIRGWGRYIYIPPLVHLPSSGSELLYYSLDQLFNVSLDTLDGLDLG